MDDVTLVDAAEQRQIERAPEEKETLRNLLVLVAWCGVLLKFGEEIGAKLVVLGLLALAKQPGSVVMDMDSIYVMSDFTVYFIAPMFMYPALRRMRRYRGAETPLIVPERVSAGDIARCFCSLVALTVLISGIVQLMLAGIKVLVIPDSDKTVFTVQSLFEDTNADGPAIYGILSTCIISPLAEEFIFRHMVLDEFRAMGNSRAILYSAVLFGFFHGNLNQGAYAFAVGLIFAYIAIKTQSIVYTCILHIAINSYNYLFFALEKVIPESNHYVSVVLLIELFVCWTGVHLAKVHWSEVANVYDGFKTELRDTKEKLPWELVAYITLMGIICLKDSFV